MARLPGTLANAGQLPHIREIAETDTAHRKLAHERTWAATETTTMMSLTRELCRQRRLSN